MVHTGLMIQSERIFFKKTGTISSSGDFVLYWMQQSQRSVYNHALEYAVGEADRLHLPLVVLFVLTSGFGGTGRRHYRFLIEGLEALEASLKERGIGLLLRPGNPPEEVSRLAGRAALLVMDTGYTRVQRLWRDAVAGNPAVICPVAEVESDLVVPNSQASQKEEYSAATIRKKIHRVLFHFMTPLESRAPERSSIALVAGLGGLAGTGGLDPRDAESLLTFSGPEIPPVSWIRGGEVAARAALESFIESGRLERFHEDRNDPGRDRLSGLSPYFHFGQLSALEAALAANEAAPGAPGTESFLEELIIRRELAFNFVLHNPDYDNFNGLPRWAREDLELHAADRREWIYSLEQLENAETHDPYWNAAQRELTVRGKMHGYMRMYWGKKILEWTASPSEALDRIVLLNDRWSLDGRDPNGYAGAAWCLGKHDRPWASRPIFGKVRYMNDRGLERKFDIKSYVERISRLT